MEEQGTQVQEVVGGWFLLAYWLAIVVLVAVRLHEPLPDDPVEAGPRLKAYLTSPRPSRLTLQNSRAMIER